MFNLIFVDDESIIRNGIGSCVPWGSNGFNLLGMFEDGEKAYEFICNNSVDVVITDINMPKMDGLTLSKMLSDKFPGIMVLLLSGYDDFEYAQQAVKNHVREFLLKPITASELSLTLENVKKELTQLRVQEKVQKEMIQKLKISFPLLKERFFNRMILGRLTYDNYIRRKEYFKWDDLGEFYQVSVIGMPESWSELDRITLHEYIRGSLDSIDEVFFNTNENIVLLTQDINPDSLENKTKQYIENSFRFTTGMDKDQISTGCGDVVKSYNEISSSYAGAINAYDYTRVLGLSQIISIKDVRCGKKIIPETFVIMLSQVIEELKIGSKEKSLERLNSLFSYLEEHFITTDEAFSYYSRINHGLDLFIQEMGLYTEDDFIFLTNNLKFRTLEQAHNVFIEYLNIIDKKINDRRHDIIISRIDRAKEIINKRYFEFNFSLQDICDELYLSISQFSFIFKEGTGQTFVEYLTWFRVEEAKKILKLTDKKVYEIAEDVGYRDPRYFSLIFKKQTGVTALEFRKRLEA